MPNSPSPNSEKIYDLKKKISFLEWDIPNIRNDELKALKKKTLQEYKNELKKFEEENSWSIKEVIKNG